MLTVPLLASVPPGRRRDWLSLSEGRSMLKCVGCGKLTVDTCVGDTCGGKPFCGECSDGGDDVCIECFDAMPDDDVDDLDDDDLDDLDDDDDSPWSDDDDDDDLDDDDGGLD